jgi:predicted amidophosphoribosyltransferase
MLDGDHCPNWLCADRARTITRIRAIAYSSGELRKKIHRYKYDGMSGWSLIFGRLLLAWLDRKLWSLLVLYQPSI